ncbi:hypothetical protein PFISCL1PPCAC_3075 [Pristionchus fissidentatus]|uniref:Thyroglobulin type-1 domain-containing protein n=1 Tax=Pristionchus fissidentatus TaxID=1538716 RepID=A0AAV5UYD8_9BILA|nr:hypothetical protein PFISCL1PPCAC_3075 [Pristionchus fissidentatus]
MPSLRKSELRSALALLIFLPAASAAIAAAAAAGKAPPTLQQGAAKPITSSSGFFLQESPKSNVKTVETGPLPCEASRRDLLKQLEGRQSSSPTAIYLPQCDMRDESLYKRLQCHGKSGVCWCVDIVTGDPVTEDCEGSTATVEIQSIGSLSKKRDIKRCSKSDKVARFYKKLFATFQEEQSREDSQKSAELTSINTNESKQRSKFQQAILWKFKSLDKNKNEILERSEWRGYRKAIRMWQGVRTCARNFFRYCDADLNRKITPEEWRDCTFPNIGLVLIEKPPPVNPFISGLLIEDKNP